MISAVIPSVCFVDGPEGLAQVVWLDLQSTEAVEAEAWVEGPGLVCPSHWRGTLAAGVGERAEIAVLTPAGAVVGSQLRFEAVVSCPGSTQARHSGDLVVAEPGWVMYMVPHFHYDPVWWNTQASHLAGWDELVWAQGYRRRYEHTGLVLVAAHLERARLDPDYKFVLAEVDYLQPFWDLYPQRREELRRLLAEERLEIVGGTYNEPNTNLVGAETAVRSAIYGMGFQRDVLGAQPESAWPLDVEAHDPSFPGIMADCGLTSSSWARGPFHQYGPKFHTGSTTWAQFPTEFEWVAPNGKSLLTSYMPTHYAAGWELDRANTLEEAMRLAYSLFCDLAAVSATKVTLLPVGTDYTPPNKWVTQLARAWADRYAWPRFVTGLPKQFFAAVRSGLAEAGRAPVPQTREMGPVYTGKDVSYIDIKQAHRQAETALVEAEKLATLALALGHRYPSRAADKAWRQLVFNAHHDGVTGTGSDQVYLDLLGGWREAWQLAREIRASAMSAIASHVNTARDAPRGTPELGGGAQACTVFNSLGFARSEVVSADVDLSLPGARSVVVVDDSGHEVPALSTPTAWHDDGTASAVRVEFRARAVPPVGYRSYWVEPSRQAPHGWETFEGTIAGNERYLVEADPAHGGCLSRVLDRVNGREVLAPGGLGNELAFYPEYPGHPWMMAEHPEMAEGPWHLVAAGPPGLSSARPARVVTERSVLGERLVVRGDMDGTAYAQVITLLAGSSRVALRTYIDGFTGHDRLLRLRFPTAVQGGTPLAEVAHAVVARSFALIDADAAEAPWTMDTPAQGWFGLGTTLAVQLRDSESGKPITARALGVGEVVAPQGTAASPEVRALLVALVRKGVTATCTEPGANRYGALVGDSNLPDFRLSIGRPQDNVLTAAVLRSAGPAFQAEFERQLAAQGWARLWVPPSRPLAEVWVPNADLRGPRDLPVLLVAGGDAVSSSAAVALLAEEVEGERVVVNQPAWSLDGPPHQAPGNHVAAADWTVALFNRGTPGFAVDTAGAFHVSLLRSCTGFPAGVWIDPPRRAAPDGSNFQAEHWSHVYDHALGAGEGDWRSAGFVAQSQEFNTALQAWLGPTRENGLAPTGSLLQVVNTGPGQVLLSALKPAGNPLARGRLSGDEGGLLVTVRLYETAGRPAEVTLRPGLGLAMTGATATNMLEEPGEALRCPGGELMLSFAPFEIRTVRLALQEPTGAGGKRPSVGPPPAGAPTAEAAQPVFSRYWLHNKGPAPVGNQALGVHLSSSWVAARAGDEPVPVLATITSDVSDATQAGTLEIVTPEGWRAEPPSAPFELAPGAHLDVPVRLVASDRATPGRYFVAARVADTAGQPQEDVVTVDLLPWNPLGPYAPDDRGVLAGLEPAGGFRHPGSQAAAEIEASVRPGALVVAPGGAATLELAVTNRTSSALWGEAQLVSPIETWPFTGPWSQGFRVERGAETTVRFWAKVPGDAVALSSWLLVKVMYFGRLWYSPTVPFQIAPGAERG